MQPQVPAIASGNRTLSSPQCIKPVLMELPKRLFALDRGGLGVVESSRGVQQRCNLGPLFNIAGSLKILKTFEANPPVPERDQFN